MKNLALAIGISGVVALAAWSCGSDVSNDDGNGGSTSSSGTGGGGGTTSSGTGGTTTTTSSTSSTTTTQDCDSTTCAEACCHVDTCFPGGCAILGQYIPGFDACEATAACAAGCVNAADCNAILSLAGGTPDPDLITCVTGCQGGTGGGGAGDCYGCAQAECLNEALACLQVPACQTFGTCLQGCSPGDSVCLSDCATANPSAETTALMDCLGLNCASECLGTGGAGGGN